VLQQMAAPGEVPDVAEYARAERVRSEDEILAEAQAALLQRREVLALEAERDERARLAVLGIGERRGGPVLPVGAMLTGVTGAAKRALRGTR
jgi:hypothetical protein